MNKFSIKVSSGITGAVVILGILVAVNVLVSQTRIRADLTGEKLYTLSSGTRALLGGLTRDVTLKLYYSKSAEGLPMPLKQYAQRIIDMLREYELHSGGHVVLEIHDPEPDSTDEEWARRYGIAGQSLNPLSDERIYLGLVAVSGTKEAAIPFFAPSLEPQLEYLLTRLVSETTTTTKPRIGILSGLPIEGAPSMPYARSSRPESWAFLDELRKQFDVVRLPPDTTDIPEGIGTLMVIHPRDFPDNLLFAIDQFVLRGGRLIAFVDPVCLSDQEMMEQSYGGMGQNSSDLNRFAGVWGYAMDRTRVVADLKSATMLRNASGQAERNPGWLSLRGENMNQGEISSSSLEFIMLPFAGAFTGSAPAGVTSQPLFTATPGSGFASAFEVTLGGRVSKIEPSTNAPVMALKLSGSFKTAFPEGRPTNTESMAKADAAPALKESTKDGVVVLVGDADMLADPYAVRRMNFLGQSFAELANDNLNFVANLVEQLGGSDYLISLRSRGSFERPFERVLALEAKAQERWKAEEEKLQAQLRGSRERLAELEKQKDPSQKLLVSEDQMAEINKFRQQQFETSRQLREVRRNLRADIEALGVKLKIINIALMPGLVAAFGIVRGINRRRRTRS